MKFYIFFNILFLFLQSSNSIDVSNYFTSSGITLEDTFTSTRIALEDAFQQVKCEYIECCNKYGIPANFTALKNTFQQRIYGQHLAEDIVLNALRSHWGKHKPEKALTLSFHGGIGCGKTYVAQLIVDNMYQRGSKSENVHHFVARLHFPVVAKVEQYQENLKLWIRSNVTKCSKQVFIFDEVEELPFYLLDVIKPFIDYHEHVEGIDYRDSIFIFISHLGAGLINEQYTEIWKTQGRKRENFKLHDFEKLIAMAAFNELGGFYRSETIKSDLIDHYVPFLPMERRHVKLCVIDAFKKRNVTAPRQEHVNEALEHAVWGGPSNEKIFATTGCKKISQKVAVLVSKHYK